MAKPKILGGPGAESEKPKLRADLIPDTICPFRATTGFIPTTGPLGQPQLGAGLQDNCCSCLCMLFVASPPAKEGETPQGRCAITLAAQAMATLATQPAAPQGPPATSCEAPTVSPETVTPVFVKP